MAGFSCLDNLENENVGLGSGQVEGLSAGHWLHLFISAWALNLVSEHPRHPRSSDPTTPNPTPNTLKRGIWFSKTQSELYSDAIIRAGKEENCHLLSSTKCKAYSKTQLKSGFFLKKTVRNRCSIVRWVGNKISVSALKNLIVKETAQYSTASEIQIVPQVLWSDLWVRSRMVFSTRMTTRTSRSASSQWARHHCPKPAPHPVPHPVYPPLTNDSAVSLIHPSQIPSLPTERSPKHGSLLLLFWTFFFN